MHTVLIATSNLHKLDEFRAIFSDLPLKLVSLNDIHLAVEVEETGSTFVENAELKARTYAQMSHMLTLADDSGLEIDALNGAPGVYSARYLGSDTSYEERFRVILEQIKDLPPESVALAFAALSHWLILLVPFGAWRALLREQLQTILADQMVLVMILFFCFLNLVKHLLSLNLNTKIVSVIVRVPHG